MPNNNKKKKLGESQFAENWWKFIDFVTGSFRETGCYWVLSPQPTCDLVNSNHY